MKPFNKKLKYLFTAVALLPAQLAFAGQDLPYADFDRMGYGMGYGMGFGGWFFGPLMMIVVFALLVGAVVLVLRLLGIGGPGQSRRNALDLLNERFARGEIDKAEYEERRGVLGS